MESIQRVFLFCALADAFVALEKEWVVRVSASGQVNVLNFFEQ